MSIIIEDKSIQNYELIFYSFLSRSQAFKVMRAKRGNISTPPPQLSKIDVVDNNFIIIEFSKVFLWPYLFKFVT